MARFISRGKNNQFKSFWYKFDSLDLFTRLFIITLILLAISTPFIVYNYQLYNARGETQNERLQEIQQLQGSQINLRNALTSSQAISNPSSGRTDISNTTPDTRFSLIDALQRILINILGFFNISK
jgi:hypothetical protein